MHWLLFQSSGSTLFFWFITDLCYRTYNFMLYHSEILNFITKVFLQNNELLNLLRLGDILLNGLISVRILSESFLFINLRECIWITFYIDWYFHIQLLQLLFMQSRTFLSFVWIYLSKSYSILKFSAPWDITILINPFPSLFGFFAYWHNISQTNDWCFYVENPSVIHLLFSTP